MVLAELATIRNVSLALDANWTEDDVADAGCGCRYRSAPRPRGCLRGGDGFQDITGWWVTSRERPVVIANFGLLSGIYGAPG
jgi:hypothetical protein